MPQDHEWTRIMMLSIKLLCFIEALLLISFGLFRLSLRPELRRLIGPVDVALVLAIPVVGLLGRDKNVFYAFLFLVPLLSLGNPARLAARYLLILPLFPGLGVNYVVGGLYLGDLSAIDAFNLGALIALSLTKRRRVSVTSIDVAVWTLFLISLLIRTRGIPVTGVLRSSLILGIEVIPSFYVVMQLIRTRDAAMKAMLFLVLGAFCNAVVAVFESIRGWPLYQAIYDALHVPMVGLSATLSVRAGFLRAQGALTNPATLGLLEALAFLAMLSLGGQFKRGGRFLIMALLVGGMIGSQSRGAWIALVVGIALYLVYERRTALLATFVSAGVVIAAAVLAIAPSDSWIDLLIGRSGQGNQTADYRSSLLSRGLQEIVAHPLSGQTRAALEVTMNDMRQGEHIIDFVNTHLSAALTGGLGALVLWLFAWAIPMVVGWRVRRRATARAAHPRVAVPFAMVGTCFVCLAFTSTIDRMVPMVLVTIGLMSAFVRLAKTREVDTGVSAVAPPVGTRIGTQVAPAAATLRQSA